MNYFNIRSKVLGLVFLGISSLAILITGQNSIAQVIITILLGVCLHLENTIFPQFMLCIDTVFTLITGLCISLDKTLTIPKYPNNPLFATWLWAFSFQFIAFALLLKQHTVHGSYKSLSYSLHYLNIVDFQLPNGSDISLNHLPKNDDLKNGFRTDQEIIKLFGYTFTFKAFLLCLIFNGISFFVVKYGWLTMK